MTEYADIQTRAHGSDDGEREFDEMMTQIEATPVTTDAEKEIRDMLCEQLRFAYSRLKQRSKESIEYRMAQTMERVERMQATLN